MSVEPRCGKCDYIVIGLPSRFCPECGANLDVVGIRTSGRRRAGPWMIAGGGTIAIAAMVIGQSDAAPIAKVAGMAITVLVCILAVGRLAGAVRLRWWAVAVLLLVVPLSFPLAVVSQACASIVRHFGREYELSWELTYLWIGLAPLIALSSAPIIGLLVRSRGIRFEQIRLKRLFAWGLLPVWFLLCVGDGALLYMFAGMLGSPVAELVTPDGKWKLKIVRSGFVDVSETAHLESNVWLPLTCRALGTVGVERDGYGKIVGILEAASDNTTGVLSVWQRSRAVGAWSLNPLHALQLENVGYRLTPPGGTAPSPGAAYRARVERGLDGGGYFFDAIEVGDAQAVRAMIDAGADANRKRNDSTPLHLAVFHGHLPVAALLLEKGADVNATTYSWKSTALLSASTKRNVAMVRLLLDHGADPNTATDTGGAPLMSASWYGPIEVVQLLLDRGSNPDARNDKGESAMDLARMRGLDPIVELLRTRTGTRTGAATQP